MSLTREQFAQAHDAEASQLRMAQLQRLTYRQLQQLLLGDPRQAAIWIR
ncbi:MAG: hypothetical protein WDM77_17740 [Steroidobacteraceae bacterium]